MQAVVLSGEHLHACLNKWGYEFWELRVTPARKRLERPLDPKSFSARPLIEFLPAGNFLG
jgi:hypothetical protein